MFYDTFVHRFLGQGYSDFESLAYSLIQAQSTSRMSRDELIRKTAEIQKEISSVTKEIRVLDQALGLFMPEEAIRKFEEEIRHKKKDPPESDVPGKASML